MLLDSCFQPNGKHLKKDKESAVLLSPEASPRAAVLQESEGIEQSVGEPPTTAEKLFTVEALQQELYATERARTHSDSHAATEKDTDVEPARKELVVHHAYAIRHVGRWTGETLSDAPEEARYQTILL